MNQDMKYRDYALCREMLETAEVVKNFTVNDLDLYAEAVKEAEAVMITGEGSSRIFPAKNSIVRGLKKGLQVPVFTEGATQALEYDLSNMCVFGASNSGKTKELIRLFHGLKEQGHKNLFGQTANADSPLEQYCQTVNVLSCGAENAVAATKSVVEQALFYHAVFEAADGRPLGGLKAASENITQALSLAIPEEISEKLAGADTVYFAGRNNGVAEELTLKTNEITRKKSDFLEGTYAAHGIEEVMQPNDVVIVIDPFEEEEAKFLECLRKGVGLTLISISARKTSFPYNIVIPEDREFRTYTELAAGWNLLVEAGLKLGVDLDRPVRARKVGNEFFPS